MSHAYLWVPFTLAAAFAQVLRNAAQARLSERIGTLGGTQVRFIFGLPFGIILLAGWLALEGSGLPPLPVEALGWSLLGAFSQIIATFLMLVVMGKRDFGVAYAYIKTEPVTVALLGLVLIGDRLPLLGWIAVIVVTIGVVMASLRPNGDKSFEPMPLATGVLGGALFGLSAISFRAAIDLLPEGSFVMRSLTILVVSLSMQSAILGTWFAFHDRKPLTASLHQWRLSMLGGVLGAVASACWFIGFSLTAAANVRTLALIEMPVVAVVSWRISGRWLSRREWAGFVLVTIGVALLLLAHSA